MSKEETRVDMKDVELNEVDQEKQPMTAPVVLDGVEKNGALKVKVAEDEEETKFTGLSKEELLKVAGTPGWVRIRWALLILFWLGWLGMLAGAVVIIVQAPRCKDLPTQDWWQKGALYQIGAVQSFQDSNQDSIGDLTGIQQRMDALSALKVKGLVIGPIHVTEADNPEQTDLMKIDPQFGKLENFTRLLETARKKSIKIILDLTPNYKGENVWFNASVVASSEFQSQMTAALSYWLEQGVAGIQLGGIELLNAPVLLEDWRNLTSNYSSEGKTRVFIASTDEKNLDRILKFVNETGDVVVASNYLLDPSRTLSASEIADRIQSYITAAGEQWISWSVGGRMVGHMASLVQERLLRLYHIMLFTLPGTPFTNYGDEIGLQDLPGQPAISTDPVMHWDDSFGFSSLKTDVSGVNANTSVKAQNADSQSLINLYKHLSELKVKERSLLHGELVPITSDANIYAFLRSWDQNERFLSVLNFADTQSSISLTHTLLPAEATVVLSSNPQRKEGQVQLNNLQLAPTEGLLLQFPYTPS
uniref:4F2 cell-surface antigen heavy chain n=1 Tax=Geotrypetes seraphini TaxID=260995 RepID=A0A6P8S5G8_GEOSA|nr:4F2 cell-surface antigen heavy chain [Geotrypetes seraphini]XP_033812358.1 4F2 cell-surface antigen heavy chain [Geotrypetes seraphini]